MSNMWNPMGDATPAPDPAIPTGSNPAPPPPQPASKPAEAVAIEDSRRSFEALLDFIAANGDPESEVTFTSPDELFGTAGGKP